VSAVNVARAQELASADPSTWPSKVAIGLDVKYEGPQYDIAGRDFAALAHEAEDAGFESLWTNEDIGYDSIALLSAAAGATERMKLGTAVVNVYNRTAMQLAMGIATLDELSAGRAILGLSIGHHPWNDLGHGQAMERPLRRLSEYVAFLRKALSGDAFTYDGEVFSGVRTALHFRPVRPALPIHVAGERPRIIGLAGRLADGLIINVVSPEYVSGVARDQFLSSAKEAGRDTDGLELTALVTCCVAGDRDSALEIARSTIAYRLRNSAAKMLDTQPASRHVEIQRVHDLLRAGKRAEALDAISEELVASIVVFGTPRDIVDGLARYAKAGCTRVVAAAYPRNRHDVDRLIQALRPIASGTRP
jgi:alkanesulfonate monooxygenase SsuD/methylene tetrahydromethanopterin reductase-like flavin-dependent oxidoreductase (luciferase family)